MRTPRAPFLATRPAQPRDYLGAGLVLSLVVGVAAAVAPYAPFQPELGEQSFSVCYVGAIVVQAVSALLLYGQWRAGRHASTGFLAVAFAYSTLMLAVFVAESPLGLTPAGIVPLAPGTMGYLWAAWLLGTFVLVACFIVTVRRERPLDLGIRAAAAAAASFAAFATVATVLFSRALPVLSVAGKFTELAARGLNPFVLAAGIATLVALVAATCLRRSIDVYAGLFVLGLVAHTYLVIIGADRYSFGRLGGRVEVLVVSLTVAFVLIGQVNQMYWQLTAENRRLAHAAMVDPLTGLANRRAFDVRLESLEPNGVLLLIDVDRFKAYNDLEGHAAGDECIRRVARTLAANVLRSDDLIARWGGDEFAAILQDIDFDDAIHVAERIRRAVADLEIPAHAGAHLTVSIGCAAFSPGEAPSEVVRRADEALYRAKADGRNRVAFDESAVFESA